MSTPDPQLRTPLQRQIMGWIKIISQRKLKANEPLVVTTRELTKVTSRYGQVLGHSCGALADRGLLVRTAPATYRMTRAGLEAMSRENVIADDLFQL